MADDDIALCQGCGEPLSVRDIARTQQAKWCQACWHRLEIARAEWLLLRWPWRLAVDEWKDVRRQG
jgi:recombinational DNA repair protein (RecF pathway)